MKRNITILIEEVLKFIIVWVFSVIVLDQLVICKYLNYTQSLFL